MLISSAMTQGYRQYMEDTLCVQKNAEKKYLNVISCHIFDGHGGDQVSKLCEKNIIPIFNHYLHLNPDLNTVLRQTYSHLDFLSLNESKSCGSTAVSVIFSKNNIWFANCGDSEGIVIFKDQKTKVVTQRHKVEDETQRLISLGANITYDDGCARINRMLNVARSIGDHHLKQFVKSSPYITSIKNRNIEYVVIASDGLWDVLTPEDVKDITNNIRKNAGLNVNKKELLDLISIQLVKISVSKGSTDNITVVVISPENEK